MLPAERTPAHLADMLQFVRELRQIAADRSLADYMNDRLRNLATEKLFINLGEAAQRVDPATRGALTGVPWRQIIGLRNILAHGYEQVDHETLFRTMVEELEAVEATLAAHLDRLTGST